MKPIKMIGRKIKLVNTEYNDIDSIIHFEKINSNFVCQYIREKHQELIKSEECLHLSIRRIDTDKLIGHMILFGLSNPNKVLEFRRLTIMEKGQGFGRDAVRLLKKLCFENLKYHRLWLDVFDDNPIAIKLYESEGFIKEGTLRECYKSENGYRSQRIYSMLEDEYKQNKNQFVK
jgi:RimJ/RimL family protein N-acetyltransferase